MRHWLKQLTFFDPQVGHNAQVERMTSEGWILTVVASCYSMQLSVCVSLACHVRKPPTVKTYNRVFSVRFCA